MIRRNAEQNIIVRENMGGEGAKGAIELRSLLENDNNELLGKGRLFSKVTIKPGDILGYHVHQGEMESYYILSGIGEYNDNGEISEVKPGDVTITNDGQGHGVKNIGNEDLVFIALIIYS